MRHGYTREMRGRGWADDERNGRERRKRAGEERTRERESEREERGERREEKEREKER